MTLGFHSPITAPILGKLEDVSKQLAIRKPEIHFESRTPDTIDPGLPDRPFRHAKDPVYFLDVVQRIETLALVRSQIECTDNCDGQVRCHLTR